MLDHMADETPWTVYASESTSIHGWMKSVLDHYQACRKAADSNIYTLRFLSETMEKE